MICQHMWITVDKMCIGKYTSWKIDNNWNQIVSGNGKSLDCQLVKFGINILTLNNILLVPEHWITEVMQYVPLANDRDIQCNIICHLTIRHHLTYRLFIYCTQKWKKSCHFIVTKNCREIYAVRRWNRRPTITKET